MLHEVNRRAALAELTLSDIETQPPGGDIHFDVNHAFLLWGRRLSHHAVIYVPTGLVVMALRNASGEVTVEMVSVPSPTP